MGPLSSCSPPAQWVKWGLVKPDVLWTLEKAVYGLRQSPKWWSDERDARLRELTWKDPKSNRSYYLEQSEADSQLWFLKDAAPRPLF